MNYAVITNVVIKRANCIPGTTHKVVISPGTSASFLKRMETGTTLYIHKTCIYPELLFYSYGLTHDDLSRRILIVYTISILVFRS